MSTALYHNWQNAANPNEQYAAMLGMLERADADRVLDDVFDDVAFDKKKGRSAWMSRWAIPATNTTPVAEGVSNVSRALVPEDVYVSLSEYLEVFSYSSQAAELDPLNYADGVAEVGHDLVKLDRTAIRWAAMRSGTQRIYNSSSLSARNTVNGIITAGRITHATTILRNAKGKTFSDLKLGSNRVGTTGLMPSFVMYGHEHLRGDIQNLAGFQPVSQYPSDVRLNPYEIGCLEGGRVRVVLSPELEPFTGEGAAVGSANLRSTGGNIDVYPLVIVAKNALGHLMLKGMGTRGAGNLMTYKVDGPDRTDPGNQTRYWAARWYDGVFVKNDLWMIRIEVACTKDFN